jgi:hypothetical protein
MRAALFLLFATSAWGQLSSPNFGYVREDSWIHKMQGMPAAGVVGPALETRPLGLVAISPGQDYILATAADTGEVFVIRPNSVSVPIVGADASPAKIIVSPGGSSAALLHEGRAQILTGLPNSPLIREVTLNSADLGAVSDLGELASVSTLDEPVVAAAFFNRSAVFIAVTASHVYTIEDGVPTRSMGRDNSGARVVGAAVSTDNRLVVVADAGGKITTIDLSSGVSSSADCECKPNGLFGLGGSVFRLTDSGYHFTSFGSSTIPPTNPRVTTIDYLSVTLFDAASNRVLVVPHTVGRQVYFNGQPAPPRRIQPAAAPPPLPAVTIGGLPASSGPAQQPLMTISLASPYSLDVTGTATLTFASSVGGDDQTIQFGTGGRTVNFTIPAGTTQANFSGKANVAVLTGTVAGTITIKLSLSASGTDVTPTPPPTATITLVTTVPFIQSVQLQQATGGFTVVITGFSTTRDMVSGLFHFAPSTNATLAASDVTVQLGAAFTSWYSNTASNAVGSQFLLTVPFTTQNGPPGDIVAVTVTLTNSKGTSNPVVNQ